MALLDFFSRGKRVPLILQKSGCKSLSRNVAVAMPNRIIYRSYVKIFLRSFVNTYKSIRKWLPSSLSKKNGDISILELNVTLPEAEESK